MRVTAAQAALLTGRNERLIRWHITRGDLPAVKDGRAWAIEVSALEALPGWRVSRDRLADLEAAEASTAASMAARLDALERRLRAVEALVSALVTQESRSEGRETTSGGMTGVAHHLPPYEPPSAYVGALGLAPDVRGIDGFPETPRRAVPTVRLGASLPDGLAVASSFAELHGVAVSTMMKAIKTGRLPAHAGRWKVGRTYATHALDADGRATFYALWSDQAGFRRCPDCPHG